MIADGPRQPSREAADIIERKLTMGGGTIIELAAPGRRMDGQRHQVPGHMPPRYWDMMIAPRWRLEGMGGVMVQLPRRLVFKRTGRYRIERDCHVYFYELESEQELELLPEQQRYP